MHASHYPVLKHLGLSDGEIEVYETLIELGKSKASDLVPKTSLKRANLYHVLSSLQQKGLIITIEGKQTVFEPKDPSILWSLFEERERELKKTQAELSASLPFLASTLNKSLGRPSIQIFEGEDGVRRAMEQTLEATTHIYAWIDTIAVDQHPIVSKADISYIKRRTKKGIIKKFLVSDTINIRQSFANIDKSASEIRYIKDFPNAFGSSIQTYNNTTFILTLHPDRVMSILISDETITGFLRQLFEYQWNQVASQQ